MTKAEFEKWLEENTEQLFGIHGDPDGDFSLDEEINAIRVDDLRTLFKDHVLVPKSDLRFLLSFAPDDCPEGLDPTCYRTLRYEGDKVIQDRVDSIKALIANTGDKND